MVGNGAILRYLAQKGYTGSLLPVAVFDLAHIIVKQSCLAAAQVRV